MEIHGFFPIKFYGFQNLDLVNKCIEMLAEEEKILSYFPNPINQTVGACLQREEKWNFLTEWVESCLSEIKEEQQLQLDGYLKVSAMWGNMSPPKSGGRHTIHRHASSYVSGIYYLTEGAPTVFSDPVYARSLSSLEIPALNNQDSLTIEPKPGTMVVFPSYVQHFSEPHYGDDNRLTIAWNSFPQGSISQGQDGKNYVKYQVS
jgi:uncharacterized protein (TIGR02466 family)